MSTRIDLEVPILAKNDRTAASNRELFGAKGVFVLDLLASPGAGKTSTILATIDALRERYSIAVIEGDIASRVDSEKIKDIGIPAVQINTGGICHLESEMIKRAVDVLDLDDLDLIIIENVGNLVCPTDFDLGENAKVMILSVPEGDDKPLKYPGIFQASRAVVLNKVDTMPVFDFDETAFVSSVAQLNPDAPIFPISATKGDGVEEWTAWLSSRIEDARVAREDAPADADESAEAAAPADADESAEAAAPAETSDRRGGRVPGMDPERAWELVCKYNDDPFHRSHARTVGCVMRIFARELDPGREEHWECVGLLHDIDFERWPDEHCVKGEEILRDEGVPSDVIASAMSHGWSMTGTTHEPSSEMDKVLFAADELTGLIGACAAVRPSGSCTDMELKSLKKKFKQPSFAAGCSRDTIRQGAEMLGWDLDELLSRTLEACGECEAEVARTS